MHLVLSIKAAARGDTVAHQVWNLGVHMRCLIAAEGKNEGDSNIISKTQVSLKVYEWVSVPVYH